MLAQYDHSLKIRYFQKTLTICDDMVPNTKKLDFCSDRYISMKLEKNMAICQEKCPILPLCNLSPSASVQTCKPTLFYNIRIFRFSGIPSNKIIQYFLQV